jgi:hypothetical protein
VSVPAVAGSNVSVALVHYPVYDKNRQVVATAITNLDLHDIARSARTYGLFRYYVVTPVVEQQRLADQIRQHWIEGWGATYNPKRRAALELIRVVADLDAAGSALASELDKPVRVVMTGAKGRPGSIGYAALAELLRDPGQHYLLVFGTGWGMTEELLGTADLVLEPVSGGGEYNHLSVRSAAAIIFDRLLGGR